MKKPINYNNPETLKSYALWYYLRYYPSVGKLTKKLSEKTQDKNIIKKVLELIKDDLREDYLLEIKIQDLLDKGKTSQFIINKLIQKDFKKEDIIKIIENLDDKNNFKSIQYIKQKIEGSQNRKSIKTIKLNLLKSGFDKEIIESVLQEFNIIDDETKILSEIEKLTNKGLEKTKIIEKLIAKGYNYKDFKELI